MQVLGAYTGAKGKEEAVNKMGQILGIEDSASLKNSREIVELLTQSLEEAKKLSDTNTRIFSTSGLSLLNSIFKVNPPIDETNSFLNSINPILDTLKKEEALSVKAHSLGFDLGAAFQLAIINPDEESIKTLEDKIKSLESLGEEEKQLLSSNIPIELRHVLEKSISSGNSGINQFKDIPVILRNKDGLALQNKLANLLIEASGNSVKIKVEMVTFLKNDSTIRSIDSLKDQWSDSEAKI